MKTVVSAANVPKTTVNLPNKVTIITKNEPNTTGDSSQLHFAAPENIPTSVGNNKRPASLDLNKSTQNKKTRLTPLLLDSSDMKSLNTPDLGNIKPLSTPDLEKILLSGNMLQTPQPGTVFPTKVGPITTEQEEFGKGFEDALHNLHTSKNPNGNVTTEQEEFGKGFDDALHSLHTGKNAQGNLNNNSNTTTTAVPTSTTTAVTGMSGGSFTYTNLESPFPVSIKDEPQNPSSSPPVSPIDMETQEKIKLERKRQRNRVAASKCRKRKLERISKLEEKVKVLKTENNDLGSVVKNLKDHVAQLKEQVMEHFTTGCNIPTVYSGSTLLSGK